MPNAPASSNVAERAFETYRNMTAAERKEFSLLCRGFDSAAAPKQPNARSTANRATKPTPAAGKENAAAS